MSNLSRKVVAVGLTLTTAVWFAGSVLPAFAQTSAGTIATLMAQIQALQAQLVALQGSAVSAPVSTTFAKDLTLGSKGADVTALQGFLISGGFLKIAAPTAYFGPVTKAAVTAWQKSAGVSATGYFGPKSRAAIALAGGVVVPGTTPGTGPVVVVPTGSDLVVSLASDTPGALIIGSGTAFNKVLKVNLTAGAKAVKVTGVTLQKTGFVANTNLNGVDIIDAAGVRHGNVITSINADNTIGLTFPNAPITVPAGQSTSFMVRFNLLTGNLSGTVGFSIAAASAILADTTAISGSFPIAGSVMQIVDGSSSLASTSIDVLTGTGSSTLNVDAVSLQEITKFRVQETSSKEAVKLYSVTLYNQGSGADADVKDVQLSDQAGNVLATAQQVGKYVNFVLATPFLIDKGQTKDFTVKAKIIDGAARTINFVVYNNYDIDLRGAGTGVSVIPGGGSNDSTFPVGNGFNIQTVGSGSLTQIKASDSPSSAVVPGSTGVVLAKYNVKPIGENYELRAVKFYIATTTTGVFLTGTVYVKVNGATVYSTGASSISPSAATEYTLSSYPVITAGQDSVITIEGSILSSATTASTYQVKSFQITSAKQLVTNSLVSNPTSATDANVVSVKAAALKVTTLATPVEASIVAGTSQYEYATVQLDATTGGEDVSISKIIVTSDGNNLPDVQNLYFYKDSVTSPLTTSASTASNGATITFNFSSPIVVTKTTPVTLHLKADAVSGAAAHTFNVASTSAGSVTAVGVGTGNQLVNGTDITYAGGGQPQTHVASGKLVLSPGDIMPNTTSTVVAGTTGLTFFSIKMISQYEAQKLTKLVVYASSTLGGLSTTTLRNVRFYNGTTLMGTAEPVCQNVGTTASSTVCSFTISSDELTTIPIAGGATIYVKGDIGAGGVARLGDSFKFLMASSTADATAKGASTGNASVVSGVPAATGVAYVTSQSVVITAVSPTAAAICGSTAAGSCTTGNIVGVFKITNNGAAAIRLSTSTTFTFNETGASSSTYKLFVSGEGGGPSDAGTALTAAATSSLTNSSVYFNISAASAANRQIGSNANSNWRYLTIKTQETAAAGSRFAFSINNIGQLGYQVDNTALGYDSDPYESALTPLDLSGVAQGLFIDGKPSLSTISTGY